MHPIAQKLGITTDLLPNTDLYYYPSPLKQTHWEVARVTLTSDNGFEFSIKDDTRIFSASFNAEGVVTALACSTGLPQADTNKVIALFCEEARVALDDLVLLH